LYDCSIFSDVEVLINQLKSEDVGADRVTEIADDDQSILVVVIVVEHVYGL
jgi:hypothetical protein